MICFQVHISGCQKKAEDQSSTPKVHDTTLFPFQLNILNHEQDLNTDANKFNSSVASLASGEAESGCEINIPDFLESSEGPSCFGPEIYFANHPDVGRWNINIDGDYSPSVGYPDDSVFGKGQLGIWTENEGGEACILANVRSVLTTFQYRYRLAQILAGAVHCSIQKNKLSLPAAGQTISLNQDLANSLIRDSRVTVGAVEFTRDPIDYQNSPVYKYNINLSVFRTQISLIWHHIPIEPMNKYLGKVNLTVEPPVGGGYTAELIYKKDGNIIQQSSLNGNHFVIVNNDLLLGSSSASVTHGYKTYDPMGPPDYNRVVKINQNGDGSGCGFHGYSLRNDNPKSTSITSYRCNAGGGSFYANVEDDLAQKQCFGTDHKATISKTKYAPLRTCNKSVNQVGIYDAVTCCGQYDYFRYSTSIPQDWSVAGHWEVNESHAVSHDLMTISVDPDFANFKDPEPPSWPL